MAALLLSAGCANGTTSGGDGRADGSVSGGAPTHAAELAFQCADGQVCAVSTDGRSAEQLGEGQAVSVDGGQLLSAGTGCSYCDQGSLTVGAAGAKAPSRTIWRYVGEERGGPAVSPDNRRVAIVIGPSDTPGGPSGTPTPTGLGS